mmetsp:Transcript_24139/g.52088  ORF Transcript_24139/g.52088 Transcript_24139/m.52088 type:complete len:98 (+) Transcript_24139:103-396(+)
MGSLIVSATESPPMEHTGVHKVWGLGTPLASRAYWDVFTMEKSHIVFQKCDGVNKNAMVNSCPWSRLTNVGLGLKQQYSQNQLRWSTKASGIVLVMQ